MAVAVFVARRVGVPEGVAPSRAERRNLSIFALLGQFSYAKNIRLHGSGVARAFFRAKIESGGVWSPGWGWVRTLCLFRFSSHISPVYLIGRKLNISMTVTT